MTKQRFTPEFADEAVRLAHTSGRTQREIAEDLGIGLSTLVRWIGRSRDRLIDTPAVPSGEEDSTAELKRLRRENEILRQEREILKRATTFFALFAVKRNLWQSAHDTRIAGRRLRNWASSNSPAQFEKRAAR